MDAHTGTITTFRRSLGGCRPQYEVATLQGSRLALSIHGELFILLVEVKSVLNSRPLVPLDSSPEDGVEVLTPGHFLVGKALKSISAAIPVHKSIYVLRRWNICQRLAADFWERWVKEYVLHLQRFNKWSHPQRQVQVGDMVLLKDTDLFG